MFNTYVHFSQWTYCSNGYRFSKARTSPRVLFAQNGATTSSLTGQAFLEQHTTRLDLASYLHVGLLLVSVHINYLTEIKIIRNKSVFREG